MRRNRSEDQRYTNLLAKGLEHPFSTEERLTGSEFSLDKIVEFSGKIILLPE